MTEHDEQDVTRTGATAASTQERYDDGMRTDDDQSVDPQEEVEERLKGIEEERRAERAEDVASPRDDEGGDDEDPDDDIPTDRRTGESTGVAAEEGGDDARSEEDPRVETDEEKRAREEAFAAEHDPEQHDLSKGEEFRQAGDWTAEDGKLTEDDVADSAAGSDEQGADGEQGVDGRRLSSVEEIRDGGYGVGSAAPIEDGAMPLDHSVKAWEDSKTYLVQGEDGYDGVDPHVWFLDDRSAERAGFDHAG